MPEGKSQQDALAREEGLKNTWYLYNVVELLETNLGPSTSSFVNKHKVSVEYKLLSFTSVSFYLVLNAT